MTHAPSHDAALAAHGRRPGPAEWAGGLALVALVAAFAASPIYCTDFHWHLAIGRVIAERGAIPGVDLFSAVGPERPYVQFNWLWDWLAFQVHAAGGLRAVRAAQAACLATSFALLLAVTRRALADGARAFAVCALALVLFEDRFRVRPDAMTLGFVAAMLPFLLDDVRTHTRARLAAAAALGALWSNLHGGASLLFPLSTGAVAVGAMLDARLAGRTDRPPAHAWRLFAASALGVALSPTTLPGLRTWFGAIGPQLATGNQEWAPTWTMLQNGLTPSFVTIAFAPTAIAFAYVWVQVRRVRGHGRAAATFHEWLLAAGYLVLAHQAVRNAFLCVVPALLSLRRHDDGASPSRPRVALAPVLVSVVLVTASVHDHVVEGYGGFANAFDLVGYDLAPDRYPEEAARFLDEAGLEGGVLNDGTWGGYLIWRAWPALHVFVDTRHHLTPEMWPVFLAAHRPLERPRAMDAAFRAWGVELAVFRGPTFPLVTAPRAWQLLYKAGDQEVYQHREGAHAGDNLARARDALRAAGIDPGAPGDDAALAEAATRAGATRWLAARYQKRRAARADRALAGSTPAEQARGHRIRGDLRFRSGDYAGAATDLEQAAALAPGDLGSRVRAALAHFALGHHGDVRAALARMHDAPLGTLSAAERGTLALLAGATDAR